MFFLNRQNGVLFYANIERYESVESKSESALKTRADCDDGCGGITPYKPIINLSFVMAKGTGKEGKKKKGIMV